MTRDDDAAREPEPAYPHEWEADVVLSDGSAGHLRPIRPEDADRLVAFYARVSPESKYLRFFAPYPVLSDADVRRFTHVDHRDRVAFILTVGDEMRAVGRYDRINDTDAEVAFLVEDSQQGKGVGQLLLEHLAEAGRERGIERFVAEVLPQNRPMATVFVEAGYTVRREFEDGMIMVEFPISPTEKSVEVMLRREHRAEASSVRRLLHPQRLAVVAPAARTQQIVDSLLAGGFAGDVVAVPTDGGAVTGVATAPSLADVPGGLDIVVTSLPRQDLAGVVAAAERGGAFGLYVLHSGEYGGERNRAIVGQVRAAGMRAFGPDALGIIVPELGLNASPAPMPGDGVVGMFCQSSGVGVILLSTALERGLGLSCFVSTGLYADVTANDVLQYWLDDDATRVCLLSLDRIGNPRKFTRVVRALAGRKPVVLFSPGRSEREANRGAAESLGRAGERAVDAIFRQSGVIVCSRRDTMYDVAQILARQPLPAGERVRVITNSPALSGHIARVGRRYGLVCDRPVIVPSAAPAPAYADAARAALADDAVDSVVVCVVDIFNATAHAAHAALAELARTSTKPLLGVFADFVRLAAVDTAVDGPGGLPTFSSYADAVGALGQVTEYARWRAGDHGTVPDLDVDAAAAADVIDDALAASPAGRGLSSDETARLLAAYGIPVVPRTPVASLAEAVAAAEDAGWNVVLKATDPGVRGRPDAPAVFRHLDSAEEMAEAWGDLGLLVDELGLEAPEGVEPQRLAAPVVQAMVPTGVALTVGSREDAGFGPIVSVGLAGISSELLEDVAHRVPPLTDADAAAMVRDLRAAPTLFRHGDAPGADLAAVEDLLGRVARLADDHPQLAEVTLTPCIASTTGVAVVGAQVQVAPTADVRDALSRSLG